MLWVFYGWVGGKLAQGVLLPISADMAVLGGWVGGVSDSASVGGWVGEFVPGEGAGGRHPTKDGAEEGGGRVGEQVLHG